MPYCTNCGASTEGAYCPQCGKPTAQTTPAAAGSGNAPPPAATAPSRKTSPLVWVLAALLGIAIAVGVAVFTGGLWVAHKVREAGVDPDLFRENPGLAISKLVAAADPDAEVVSTDSGAGTVTLRDRRSGKEVTLSFDQVKKGNFRLEADDDQGHHALVEAGGDTDRVPAEVPVYPGAKVKSSFQVDGNGEKAQGAYEYEFTTPDAPAKILEYYHRALEDAGMKLALQTHSADGGMLVAEDDANRRTLRVIVSRGADGATINLTARMKR